MRIHDGDKTTTIGAALYFLGRRLADSMAMPAIAVTVSRGSIAIAFPEQR
jgi:hypothetical protein